MKKHHPSPATSKKRDFSRYDQELVAVVFEQGARKFVVRGVAVFQNDDKLGRILRISGEDSRQGDLILCEESWAGRILPDLEHDCRFCFHPWVGR